METRVQVRSRGVASAPLVPAQDLTSASRPPAGGGRRISGRFHARHSSLTGAPEGDLALVPIQKPFTSAYLLAQSAKYGRGFATGLVRLMAQLYDDASKHR